MHKICLVFGKSEPHVAYKRYAYKKHVMKLIVTEVFRHLIRMRYKQKRM